MKESSFDMLGGSFGRASSLCRGWAGACSGGCYNGRFQMIETSEEAIVLACRSIGCFGNSCPGTIRKGMCSFVGPCNWVDRALLHIDMQIEFAPTRSDKMPP